MRINMLDSQNIINSNDLKKDSNSLTPLEKKRGEKLKEAENVAKEFEGIYLDMMIKSMRQTAKPEDESNAHDIFQSMLDGEYAKLMTESQNFGIRDLLLNWMKENDPALNLNLKTLNNANSKTTNSQDIDATKKAFADFKNSNIINKISLDQYKIEANK